ncbi:hypothetical protein [Bacillus sp. UNC41MFS5]|uniref:hypothetical protein n=1 Tax=Bacillus sp. UNC41MFS5 TaxID=1449046 RepID=UPI000479D884|nr:hypothetical protein [Bacillus sp. UNC41MFS5]
MPLVEHLEKIIHTGEIIANIDPSNLVLQGMDLVEAMKKHGSEKVIFHFHAKDTYMEVKKIYIFVNMKKKL